MYAIGHPIAPTRSARSTSAAGSAAAVRLLAGIVAITAAGVLFVAQAAAGAPTATVVVQPGDTLWSIAAARYPGDDVRTRVDEIEGLNGLKSPLIEAGETLQLPR